MTRVLEGTKRPVHFQGKEVGTIQSYSDQLAMFLLKARRPEVFGEHQQRQYTQEVVEDAREQIERKLARLASD